MKIDIPIEIGDPVVIIRYDQRDGYYKAPALFSYALIEMWENGRVFKTGAKADEALDILNSKRNK